VNARADAAPIGPVAPVDAPGPLAGLRVVEIASEWTAYAGKLLADLGATVILVEPVGGSPLRAYGPFVNGQRDAESSLWWWHYQANKFGVSFDLDSSDGQGELRALIESAEVVLEGLSSSEVVRYGLAADTLRATDPALIVVSITPFGRSTTRADEPATDLTILAGAGPVWSCGYDDHSLPPIRGAGNQALHTAALHAVPALLVAVLHRYATGLGQHVDVSAHAASNVTTEAASYEWLVAGNTVQRQTGRHAAVDATDPAIAIDCNGRPVYTGVPPRSQQDLTNIVGWLDSLGLRDEFADIVLLEIGIERGGITWQEIFTDEFCLQIFGAGRAALMLIASRITDREFFIGGQDRGFAVGVINSPEDVMADPHFAERGFHVSLHHEQLGREVVYPGAPVQFGATPWRLSRRAPRLGEHNGSGFETPSAQHRKTTP
jgi:crotonobetainyl-CoA:carnitine CoA-transferase CaiB-like acyl-CoA transferase